MPVYFVSQWLVSNHSHTRARTQKDTHSVSLSTAWRGHVARQNLKQIKKEREEAAICIQSGKEMFRSKFSSGLSHDVRCKYFFSPFPPHFQKEKG